MLMKLDDISRGRVEFDAKKALPSKISTIEFDRFVNGRKDCRADDVRRRNSDRGEESAFATNQTGDVLRADSTAAKSNSG